MVIKDGLPAGRQGFTLVELLIVIAILAIMTVIMVGIFNPVAQMNKAYDARAKKDVNQIKVAFEEYANDNKGCFPTNGQINTMGLLNDANCGGGVFAPWLSSWPCNPKGKHYLIYTEPKACPSWFKVATKLDNLKDSDIPVNIPSTLQDGEITKAAANYGVSSTNILWTDVIVDPRCAAIARANYSEGCYTNRNGPCESVGAVCRNPSNGTMEAGCQGNNCYLETLTLGCLCPVPCCGYGCLGDICP